MISGRSLRASVISKETTSTPASYIPWIAACYGGPCIHLGHEDGRNLAAGAPPSPVFTAGAVCRRRRQEISCQAAKPVDLLNTSARRGPFYSDAAMHAVKGKELAESGCCVARAVRPSVKVRGHVPERLVELSSRSCGLWALTRFLSSQLRTRRSPFHYS